MPPLDHQRHIENILNLVSITHWSGLSWRRKLWSIGKLCTYDTELWLSSWPVWDVSGFFVYCCIRFDAHYWLLGWVFGCCGFRLILSNHLVDHNNKRDLLFAITSHAWQGMRSLQCAMCWQAGLFEFQLVSLLVATLNAILLVADWSKFWADSLCIIGRNWHRSNDLVEHKKVHDVFFATKLHGWQGMLMSLSISSALSITDLLCHTFVKPNLSFVHFAICLHFSYSSKRMSDNKTVDAVAASGLAATLQANELLQRWLFRMGSDIPYTCPT